jgi:branched-chain amino acid transport system permease protein
LLLALAIAVFIALCVHLLFSRGHPSNSATSLAPFLASLGIYVVLQNVIAGAFGNDVKIIQQGPVEVGHRVLGAYVTNVQLLTVATGLTLFIGVLLLLALTRLGRVIRGVSSDPDLSQTVGINVKCAKLWAVGIGTGLGAVAAILSALDTGMTPTMGFQLLLDGLIVMVIGGAGGAGGLLGGALLLAVAQNLTAYYFGSRWMDAVAFLILVGFLIFRPFGFSGQRLKKATV